MQQNNLDRRPVRSYLLLSANGATDILCNICRLERLRSMPSSCACPLALWSPCCVLSMRKLSRLSAAMVYIYAFCTDQQLTVNVAK